MRLKNNFISDFVEEEANSDKNLANYIGIQFKDINLIK